MNKFSNIGESNLGMAFSVRTREEAKGVLYPGNMVGVRAELERTAT